MAMPKRSPDSTSASEMGAVSEGSRASAALTSVTSWAHEAPGGTASRATPWSLAAATSAESTGGLALTTTAAAPAPAASASSCAAPGGLIPTAKTMSPLPISGLSVGSWTMTDPTGSARPRGAARTVRT